MVAYAVGDQVIHVPDGRRLTLTGVSSPNATGEYRNGTTTVSITVPLSSLLYDGPNSATSGFRVENSATATPILRPTDYCVEFTNSATTGVTARSNIHGEESRNV